MAAAARAGERRPGRAGTGTGTGTGARAAARGAESGDPVLSRPSAQVPRPVWSDPARCPPRPGTARAIRVRLPGPASGPPPASKLSALSHTLCAPARSPVHSSVRSHAPGSVLPCPPLWPGRPPLARSDPPARPPRFRAGALPAPAPPHPSPVPCLSLLPTPRPCHPLCLSLPLSALTLLPVPVPCAPQVPSTTAGWYVGPHGAP